MDKRGLVFGCIFILFLIAFSSAIPLIEFKSPTPSNAIFTNNTSIEINISINEVNLNSIIYNWNGTNFTIYNDSLVLMMNFYNRSSIGENSTYTVDVSKYGNNGTITGAVLNSSGKYNSALSFDGNDYINCSNPSSLDITGNITLAAWINTNNISQPWQAILGKQIDGTGYYSLIMDSNTQRPALWLNVGGWNRRVISSENLTQNTWYYVVGTYNGTWANIYINGILKNNTALSGSIASSPTIPIYIGMNNNVYFNGSIDEVRIWNRSLSASEIYEQYVSNLQKFNSTQWYLYINQSKNSTAGLDIGNYTYQVFAKDNSDNLNQTEQRTIIVQSSATPNILLDWIYPTSNINVIQTQFFNISVNVTCLNNNCENINVTLDPSSNTVYNFTNCNATGMAGPTQTNCSSAYNGTTLQGLVNVTAGYQKWIVPRTGTYRIEANGAGGGLVSCSGYYRGSGAKVIGEFNFQAGEVLFIVVGQKGSDKTCSDWGGGGGGFSAVVKNVTSSSYQMIAVYPGAYVTPLVVAGGAGGTGDNDGNTGNPNATSFVPGNGSGGLGGGNSGGGGGFIGDGATGSCGGIGGRSFLNGSNGTTCSYYGGFGGGGAPYSSGGGGGGFTGGNGSAWVYPGLGGTSFNNGTNQTNQSAANSGHGYITITDLGDAKSGTILMNANATPFYTNITNPYNISLNENQSQIITWWINATGTINTIYEFFVYANSTTNSSIKNQTSKLNITILDLIPPTINITYPLNTTYSTNVSSINYSYYDYVGGGYCWYSNDSGISNSSVVSSGTNFTNVISIDGSNTWTIYCNDSSGNLNFTTITFTKKIPIILLDWIYPTSNINVIQNNFFNISVNVTCLNNNCENVNVTLDPTNSTIYNFTNCGATGANGPSQANCNSSYNGTTLQGLVNVTRGYQRWVVPETGTYRIEANGAGGGLVSCPSYYRGYGARVTGEFNFQAGEVLFIVVGQKGSDKGCTDWGGGGGGFSAVVKNVTSSSYQMIAVYPGAYVTPLVVAGGAGGTGDNGGNTGNYNATSFASGNGSGGVSGGNSGGGGGFTGDGAQGLCSGTGPKSFLNGSNGTSCSYYGGFGGGGAPYDYGGGGGGFTGGNSSSSLTSGFGGTSYNNGTNQTNVSSANNNSGYVIITYLDSGKGGTISMNANATPFYTNITNPYNISLNENQSRIINWWVNATGTPNNTYEFFIYANKTADMSIGNITSKLNITILNSSSVGDITSPIINLIIPVNNTNTTNFNQYLVGNFTEDIQLKNITLNIWNSSNSIINQTTYDITGVNNQTNISIALPYNGLFKWNYYVCDNSSNCGWNATNFTINYDNTNPNAILNTPLNNSNVSNGTQNFTANITDNLGIKNATLNIYNATSLINQTTVYYSANTIISTLGIVVTIVDGTYKWFYSIFDWVGNTYVTGNNTLIVDSTYPKFSNYNSNNATYSGNISLFNVTIINSNGTAWLSINGSNYFASNSTATLFNVSVNLSNGTYMYNWSSYGNGTLHNLNISENKYHFVNFSIVCTSNLTNTSWSSWNNQTNCRINNTVLQNRSLVQYDSNYCGEVSNSTIWEYQEIACDYCSYNITNSSWSNWLNISCLSGDVMNQSRNKTEYDSNFSTCYNITGIATDLWNSGLNNTYFEYIATDSCDYCTPSLANTSWSDWLNISCVNSKMNQSRNLTQYDSNSCGEVSNTSIFEYQNISDCIIDSDFDSVSNDNDTLEGNESNVIKTGISNLNITVGGNSTYGSFNDSQEVIFYDSSQKILNFTFNFSLGKLNLSKVSISKETNSVIINLSQQLQDNYNKTMYITDNSFIGLCVKDAEINSISEISSGCNGNNETDFTSCLSNANETIINNINCVKNNTEIKISNLRNSAVRGTSLTVQTSSSSGGGSSSRGGGVIKKECRNDSECKLGYSCYNYKCVKLFDVEILNVDPITENLGFPLTYLIKGMADIKGDVIIKFWLEKEDEKIVLGQDAIYLGSFEEKTKSTKLNLPKDISNGDYELHVQVNFENYQVESIRIMNINLPQITLVPEKKIFSNIPIIKIALIIIIIFILAITLIWLIRKYLDKRETKKIQKFLLQHNIVSDIKRLESDVEKISSKERIKIKKPLPLAKNKVGIFYSRFFKNFKLGIIKEKNNLQKIIKNISSNYKKLVEKRSKRIKKRKKKFNKK